MYSRRIYVIYIYIYIYIYKSNSNLIHYPPQQSTLLTGHFSMTSQLNLSYKTYTPLHCQGCVCYHRKIKNIDYISFKTDLYNSTLTTVHAPLSLTTSLSVLLDKHVPLIYSKISIHTNSPWFNSELCYLKSHTRQLDRLYRTPYPS